MPAGSSRQGLLLLLPFRSTPAAGFRWRLSDDGLGFANRILWRWHELVRLDRSHVRPPGCAEVFVAPRQAVALAVAHGRPAMMFRQPPHRHLRMLIRRL